jgi:hypothetical protein
MTTTEILALVGALAWLPQILQWIANATKRPKLKLVSAPGIQVGYDLDGPTIGLTSSISTRRKDALISKITIKTLHEKGDQRQFTWRWFDEIQTRMRTATGETAEFSKSQPAIALQVSTLTPAEKFIIFRDNEYSETGVTLLTAVMDHRDYLKSQEADTIDALLKSKEFATFRDFYSGNMYWREGQYTFEVSLHEAHTKHIHTERFSLRLIKADIETLRKNIQLFEDGLRDFTVNRDRAQEEQKLQMRYINPRIEPLP